MQRSLRVRFFASLALLGVALIGGPAQAGRTVIDVGLSMHLGDYCSPNACVGFTTPFSVEIGGTSYNSFYANSNGTLSFGSIFPSLSLETPTSPNPYFVGPPPVTDLSSYGVPIFSPNFADGPGFDSPDTSMLGIFDGNFVADTTVAAGSFTVNWYACDHPQNCGLATVDLVLGRTFDPNDLSGGDLQEEIIANSTIPCPCSAEDAFTSGQQNLADFIRNNFPIYTMTLTNLPDGFRVDYSYNAGATGLTGTYGFSVPGASEQATGPLENRSYLFDSQGRPAVPEPATWLTMIFGFAAVGLAMRRKAERRSFAFARMSHWPKRPRSV